MSISPMLLILFKGIKTFLEMNQNNVYKMKQNKIEWIYPALYFVLCKVYIFICIFLQICIYMYSYIWICIHIYIFIFLNWLKMILPRYIYTNMLDQYKFKKQNWKKRRESKNLSSVDKFLAIAFHKCSPKREKGIREVSLSFFQAIWVPVSPRGVRTLQWWVVF